MNRRLGVLRRSNAIEPMTTTQQARLICRDFDCSITTQPNDEHVHFQKCNIKKKAASNERKTRNRQTTSNSLHGAKTKKCYNNETETDSDSYQLTQALTVTKLTRGETNPNPEARDLTGLTKHRADYSDELIAPERHLINKTSERNSGVCLNNKKALAERVLTSSKDQISSQHDYISQNDDNRQLHEKCVFAKASKPQHVKNISVKEADKKDKLSFERNSSITKWLSRSGIGNIESQSESGHQTEQTSKKNPTCEYLASHENETFSQNLDQESTSESSNLHYFIGIMADGVADMAEILKKAIDLSPNGGLDISVKNSENVSISLGSSEMQDVQQLLQRILQKLEDDTITQAGLRDLKEEIRQLRKQNCDIHHTLQSLKSALQRLKRCGSNYSTRTSSTLDLELNSSQSDVQSNQSLTLT